MLVCYTLQGISTYAFEATRTEVVQRIEAGSGAEAVVAPMNEITLESESMAMDKEDEYNTLTTVRRAPMRTAKSASACNSILGGWYHENPCEHHRTNH